MMTVLLLLIYFGVGVILTKRVLKLGSLGVIFPTTLFILWLPVLLLLTLGFLWIHMFPKFTLKLLGWRCEGKFPDIPKSILIMAPHTSSWDAVIGKIGLLAVGIDHTILSSSHLFVWPLKPFMKFGLQAIPVGRDPKKNAILEVSEHLKTTDTHVLICPEGMLRATEKWNPGFYYMAYKAQVPIVMSTMDYKTKTMRFSESVVDCNLGRKEIYQKMVDYYKDSNPKHLDRFKLPIIK